MTESVIISKELESVIDKQNVFGKYTEGAIPVVVWINNTIINSELLLIKTSKGSIRLEFMTSPKLAQDLLVHRVPDCIVVGEEESGLTLENCKTRSLIVTAKDNMYLCKIIIDVP